MKLSMSFSEEDHNFLIFTKFFKSVHASRRKGRLGMTGMFDDSIRFPYTSSGYFTGHPVIIVLHDCFLRAECVLLSFLFLRRAFSFREPFTTNPRIFAPHCVS